jgi:predicted  nucleic acid-binding Zn-ribbon protein
MTLKQTFWAIFIIAVLGLLSLMYCVNKFNTELNVSQSVNNALMKEIKDLRTHDAQTDANITILKSRIRDLEKDLDVTQDLQRKQAQAIVDLRKGKKK